MRIIAGSRARMKLIPPKDNTTRPIPDMVKEALFSILRHEVPGKVVADLFSGTGSMGLEALSRGAVHAMFVDMDREAIKRLYENIAHLKFEDECTVIRADIFKYGVPKSSRLARWQNDDSMTGVDIVFCDPPFPLAREVDEASQLGRLMLKISKQIAVGAKVVLRNELKYPTPENYGPLKLIDRRSYGIMTLNFYQKTGPEQQPGDEQSDDRAEQTSSPACS
ncbi:MAG: 16S rRNA (guanine(966)-N(2))-methyltransferase RsmD [Sedimentisphaerales bacterium]|nr:16S rRNA (guanine(966)-N(2))-methyltransferase RsmD [Sedimentisphaerales bacterium]